jgi:adenylate cyclase
LLSLNDLPMATEVELKLAFPPEALQRIKAHKLIASAPQQGQAKFLDNVYFDTPTLDLHAARIAVRTRKSGERLLQTVKCASDSIGGLSARPEWEQDYTGQFDFSTVDAKPVRKFLQEKKTSLIPIFSTVFARETHLAEPRTGVRILIMIDSGKIVTGNGEAAISELELELVSGHANDLLNFAIELAQDLPLLPLDVSKAERGFQLFEEKQARPLRANRITLAPEADATQAFGKLAAEAQRCWQANLHGLLTSKDPEFIHQYRVALRRLNTLLRIFRPMLPEAFSTDWTPALKELAQLTGEVRDLDVMQESILQPMLCSDANDEHQHLIEQALAASQSARQSTAAAFSRLADGQPLLRFTRDVLLIKQGFTGDTVRFAERRLGKMHLRAIRRSRSAMMNPTPESAHRLRIALKHLRYTCEFFASLFPEEQAMQQYAKDLAVLQDDLGFINDLHQALNRLEIWSAHNPALAEAKIHIAAWHAPRADQILRDVLDKTEQQLGHCLPWCGECERHPNSNVIKRLRPPPG